MMNQPPDDDFYSSTTENTTLPSQKQPGQAPGYPQRTQATPPNYPPQQTFPQPEPQNQPGAGPQPLPQQRPPRRPVPPQQQPFPSANPFGSPNPNGPQRPLSQPGLPPQQDFPQPGPFGPANSPQSAGKPEQRGFPQPNPQSQPGMRPEPQSFAQRAGSRQPGPVPQRPQGFTPAQAPNPASQPGFGIPNAPQRPAGGPDFAPPYNAGPARQPEIAPHNNTSARSTGQDSVSQQRTQRFPPPPGPLSQPGFSSIDEPQRDQPPAWFGNNRQSGPQTPAPQWQQQTVPPLQELQPVAPVDMPEQSKKPGRLWLAIALTVLALLVLGGGSFVLFAHKNGVPTFVPGTQSTATTSGVTPVATRAATKTPTAAPGGLNSVNTPVQAGTDWIATVTSVKETTASLIAPSAGNTYLEIHLTLKNVSGNILNLVGELEFSLTDASGHRYNEAATDTNIRQLPDGRINNNQTLNAELAYEVPATQHTFILTFAYGLAHANAANVTWKLTA